MGAVQDLDVRVKVEVAPTGNRSGAPRGDRLNTAPGRVHVIHVGRRGTIRLNVERAIVDRIPRLALGQHVG
jgi:hypothetical protein